MRSAAIPQNAIENPADIRLANININGKKKMGNVSVFCARGVAVIAAAIIIAGQPARGQIFSNQIVKVVVPSVAGGGTDVMTRVFARELERSLGATVIVENRPGAAGLIGTIGVIGSKPDGHTLLIGNNATNFIPALAKAPKYHPLDDLTPIALLQDVPNILVVNSSVPAKSLSELLALVKAKPGSYSNATVGIGSFSHVAIELLNVLTGSQIVHVPYRGGADLLPALLTGVVQMGVNPVRNVIPGMEQGKLRAVAVTSRKRFPSLPDVATIAETVPGYDADNWYGLYGPPNMPAQILAAIADATDKALASSSMQKFARDGGTTIVRMTPSEFAKFVRDDFQRWSKLIVDAGLERN